VSLLAALAVALAACSGDDASAPGTPSTTLALAATPAAVTTTTATATTVTATTSSTNVTTSAAPTTLEQPAPTMAPVPSAHWPRAAPADVGLDSDALDRIAFDAGASGSNCLVVVRHGQVAAEWYWNGADASTPQEVWSVSKSVTSALVGIAQDDGSLQIGEPAADFLPSWQGTDSAPVTVQDLLSNNSGRFWSYESDYVQMWGKEPDQSAYAIGLEQQYPPGDVWTYNNAAIQTLSEVLQAATGVEPAQFARDRLFAPIGMTDTTIHTDDAGNTLTYAGVQSTCLDLARFGLLFLHGGAWGSDQIVSSEYVQAATATPSTDLNAAYGYLWWLNREGPIASAGAPTQPGNPGATPRGQMVAAAPDDMFWAIGLGNQIVQVDPGSDTVVVRLGPTDLQSTFGPEQTARVVTEALR
jgi:CubicO group peptidase (beta-lactamase class C family)